MKTQTTESKTDKKYITLEDGCDFRKIAELMTEAGFPQNHATARNVLMSAMFKLTKNVAADIGADITEDELYAILRNQGIHDSLQDVLHQAWTEINTVQTSEAK